MFNNTVIATGCWLDGHRGWRIIADLITDVAVPLGFRITDADREAIVLFRDWPGDDSGEHVADLADVALDWLNDNRRPDNTLWLWHDGELFLSAWCGGECSDPDCACQA